MSQTSLQPVHVVGGGLAGSEAAFQLAERGVPVVLHEMRPVRGTEAHHTEALRSSSAPIPSAPMTPRPMRWACCTRRCAAPARSSCAVPMPIRCPAGGALAVDRDGFSQAVTAALAEPPGGDSPRGSHRHPAGGVGQRHHRHRPPHLARAGAGGAGADRRKRARLLRCHRPDRASGQHRFVQGLVPVAL